MNINQFLELLGKKKQTIISLVVIFLSVAIVFSAIQPFKYDSSMKLLVIIGFKQDVDPYTASRSNQYLSGLLANIVSSGSFFGQIKQSGFKIDESYFSGNTKQQMKKWKQTVSAKSLTDTGTITIDIYHPDRTQAEEIVRAVAYTLQTTNSQYHGFGNSVEIKTIDQPTTSNYPVKPNLPLNLGLAFIFGLLFSLCYIYLFPEEKYNLRLWPRKHANSYAEIEFNKPDVVPVAAEEPLFAETTVDKSAYAKATEDNRYAPAYSELSSRLETEEDESVLAKAMENKPAYAKATEDKPFNNIPTSYNPADYQVSGDMNNVFKK